MVAAVETAAPSGYLVTLRTGYDDLPQRMFATKSEARRFARTLDVEKYVNAFGTTCAGTYLTETPIAIVEFENGRAIAVEHVDRDDLPERLPASA